MLCAFKNYFCAPSQVMCTAQHSVVWGHYVFILSVSLSHLLLFVLISVSCRIYFIRRANRAGQQVSTLSVQTSPFLCQQYIPMQTMELSAVRAGPLYICCCGGIN